MNAELDQALEELERAVQRRDVRIPLIQEALIELMTCESVSLEGFLGFGRTLKCTEEVRSALANAGQEEIEELEANVLRAKETIRELREQLV